MEEKKVSENHDITKSGFVPRKAGKSSVVIDIIVVLFCLTGVAASLFLFQRDLFTALRSSNAPIGSVSIKHNTVQRRIQDRMIWDRLFDDSPVYDGDLIRVDRLSGAVINISENKFDLGENTLIRVQKSADGLNIDFLGGSINITAQEGGETIILSSGGRIVQAAPGTSFSVSSGDDGGFVLRVTEGAAKITQGDKVTQAVSGEIIVQDARGNEILEPMAVVKYPQPNVNLINNKTEPLNVEFEWKRINIPQNDRLRLEISVDRNFSFISRTIDNLDTKAASLVDSGVWYWRLMLKDKYLAGGRMNIIGEIPAPPVLAEAPPPEPELLAIVEEPPPPPTPPAKPPAKPLVKPLAKTSAKPPAKPSAKTSAKPLAPPPTIAETAPEPEPEIEVETLREITVSLLPPPERMTPADRYIIGIDELKVHRNIVFGWSEVEDANFYILTILREGFPGRRQIFQSNLLEELTFTFDDLSLLENHDKIFWHVEAVFAGSEGTIERRGVIKEHGIALNVPRPGRVRTRGVGVMYGTE